MSSTYTKNYLKIYFWQILGVSLNFLSLFIVTPKISANVDVYGIYSLCLSFVVFLSYADLGFLGAGYKYASEYFAQNKKKEEIRVSAFVSLILLVPTILFSIVILLIANYPTLIFNNLTKGNALIAENLLIILSISAPFIVCQRIMQMIYGVRVKEFIFQQFNVIGNIIKLTGVFLFFPKNGTGDIVSYFCFIQLITIFVTIVSGLWVNKYLDYSFIEFYKNIKFNKILFEQTKSIALSSLLLTISWILYYELDLLVITKLLGPSYAATYNIGLVILSLFRSLYAIIFNPFNARFNHLKGLSNIEGLKSMVFTVVRLSLPIFVLPIFIVSIWAKQLIFVWLGALYSPSVVIVQILVFCNILGFISNPVGILLIALEKNKVIYRLSLFIPILYWTIIWLFYRFEGLIIFPVAKISVFLLMGLFYGNQLLSFIGKQEFYKIIKDLVIIIPIVFLYYVLYLLLDDFFYTTKSTFGVVTNVTYLVTIFFVGFMGYIFCNVSYKDIVINLFKKLGNEN